MQLRIMYKSSATMHQITDAEDWLAAGGWQVFDSAKYRIISKINIKQNELMRVIKRLMDVSDSITLTEN